MWYEIKNFKFEASLNDEMFNKMELFGILKGRV